MRRTLTLALAALVLTLGSAADAQTGRLPVKDVIAKMQAFYEKIQDLKADFKQEIQNPTTGRTKQSYGVIKLKKPGKMRWDYSKPEKKHFISDGQTLWVYEPEDQQAFKQELKSTNLSAAVTFLSGKGNLAAEFNFEFAPAGKYGGKDDYAVKLTPKQPSAQFKSIILVVDPTSFQVKLSVVFTPDGGQSKVWFTGVQLNKKIPDAEFKFTPPSGVRVIVAPKQ
ncbi:MAG TPA: outer membrane lipoprotein chaperone LolA [Polyangia bacterium]|jgi:outer membrane lipoprotein carrier protein